MNSVITDWTNNSELIALYDAENQGLEDQDFYLDLVVDLRGNTAPLRVADIGCGTAPLAVQAAAHGAQVTGVDPAAAMIAGARHRVAQLQTTDPEAAGRIRLVEGTAEDLESSCYDVAVMVGHVAQYFLHRQDWDAALAETFRALRPGGHLAFESRNPAALDLDLWDEQNTRHTVPLPDGDEATAWMEVTEITTNDDDGPLVTARAHYLLPGNRHIETDETLRFRPLHVLGASVMQAGFRLVQLWGDWDKSPAAEDSPELILLVQKPTVDSAPD